MFEQTAPKFLCNRFKGHFEYERVHALQLFERHKQLAKFGVTACVAILCVSLLPEIKSGLSLY